MTIRNLVLSAAILAAAAAPAAGAETITKKVTVAPDATVEVSNVQGSVGNAWDSNRSTRPESRAPGRARIRGDRRMGHRGRSATGKYHNDTTPYLTFTFKRHASSDTGSARSPSAACRGEKPQT